MLPGQLAAAGVVAAERVGKARHGTAQGILQDLLGSHDLALDAFVGQVRQVGVREGVRSEMDAGTRQLADLPPVESLPPLQRRQRGGWAPQEAASPR